MADGLVHCVEKGGWYPTVSGSYSREIDLLNQVVRSVIFGICQKNSSYSSDQTNPGTGNGMVPLPRLYGSPGIIKKANRVFVSKEITCKFIVSFLTLIVQEVLTWVSWNKKQLEFRRWRIILGKIINYND